MPFWLLVSSLFRRSSRGIGEAKKQLNEIDSILLDFFFCIVIVYRRTPPEINLIFFSLTTPDPPIWTPPVLDWSHVGYYAIVLQ